MSNKYQRVFILKNLDDTDSREPDLIYTGGEANKEIIYKIFSQIDDGLCPNSDWPACWIGGDENECVEILLKILDVPLTVIYPESDCEIYNKYWEIPDTTVLKLLRDKYGRY